MPFGGVCVCISFRFQPWFTDDDTRIPLSPPKQPWKSGLLPSSPPGFIPVNSACSAPPPPAPRRLHTLLTPPGSAWPLPDLPLTPPSLLTTWCSLSSSCYYSVKANIYRGLTIWHTHWQSLLSVISFNPHETQLLAHGRGPIHIS